MRRISVFLASLSAASLCFAQTSVLAGRLDGRLLNPAEVFIIPASYQVSAIEPYDGADISYLKILSEKERFVIQMIRNPKGGSNFFLLFFDNASLQNKKPFSGEEWVASAKMSRLIETELAGLIYSRWWRSIRTIGIGYNEIGTGSRFPIQLISINSIETGPIAGYSSEVEPGSDVENIDLIGRALKRFISSGSASDEKALRAAFARESKIVSRDGQKTAVRPCRQSQDGVE